jgi:FxsC-like protein
VVEFMLSYDREDGDGGYVGEFFDALSDELARRRAGWKKAASGYLDVKQRTGSKWPDRLGEALRTARIFIPLFSERYFESVYCGREWTAFADRVRNYESLENRVTELIIPVLWEERPKQRPAVAQNLQYKEDKFPARYAERGLRRIVKLRTRFEVEYDEILSVLADRILECYDAYPMPPGNRLIDINVVADAFHEPLTTPGLARQQPASAPRAGPRRVHFVMAAATAAEIGGERADPGERYGAEADEWMPFWPDCSDPLILDAFDVAAEMVPRLLPRQVSALRADLVRLISEAEQVNAIVVLLVDAWTLRLPDYSAALRPYDDYFSLHTAVVVLISAADPETRSQLPALQAAARALFAKNYRGRRELYRDSVTSLADFRRELGEVLVRAQAQVFDTADVARPVGLDEVIPRPMITGPGAS